MTGKRSRINLPIRYYRPDEFGQVTQAVARVILTAVPEFVGNICGVEGAQCGQLEAVSAIGAIVAGDGPEDPGASGVVIG